MLGAVKYRFRWLLLSASVNVLQKPVSSVAPTSVQVSSPIYQTSSTKLHPVLPQTITSKPQVELHSK